VGTRVGLLKEEMTVLTNPYEFGGRGLDAVDIYFLNSELMRLVLTNTIMRAKGKVIQAHKIQEPTIETQKPFHQ